MSPVPDDFEQLRRLLALKKYEQPPPGYFHGFSRQVIVRINAGDLGNESELSFWSFGTGSFLQRVWAALDARPAFAGAFGVAVCGFFVAGALLSDSTAANSPSERSQAPMVVATDIPASNVAVWEQSVSPNSQVSSTMGVAMPSYQPPASSLFEEIQSARMLQQRARPEQVDFRVPANLQ